MIQFREDVVVIIEKNKPTLTSPHNEVQRNQKGITVTHQTIKSALQ